MKISEVLSLVLVSMEIDYFNCYRSLGTIIVQQNGMWKTFL